MVQLIDSLIDRESLSEAQAEASLDFLLNEADEALISAFLVLLRAKGENFEEVSLLLLVLILFYFIFWLRIGARNGCLTFILLF